MEAEKRVSSWNHKMENNYRRVLESKKAIIGKLEPDLRKPCKNVYYSWYVILRSSKQLGFGELPDLMTRPPYIDHSFSFSTKCWCISPQSRSHVQGASWPGICTFSFLFIIPNQLFSSAKILEPHPLDHSPNLLWEMICNYDIYQWFVLRITMRKPRHPPLLLYCLSDHWGINQC